jgi:hypothetical protein
VGLVVVLVAAAIVLAAVVVIIVVVAGPITTNQLTPWSQVLLEKPTVV